MEKYTYQPKETPKNPTDETEHSVRPHSPSEFSLAVDRASTAYELKDRRIAADETKRLESHKAFHRENVDKMISRLQELRKNPIVKEIARYCAKTKSEFTLIPEVSFRAGSDLIMISWGVVINKHGIRATTASECPIEGTGLKVEAFIRRNLPGGNIVPRGVLLLMSKYGYQSTAIDDNLKYAIDKIEKEAIRLT